MPNFDALCRRSSHRRGHQNRLAITVVNVLLGWRFIGRSGVGVHRKRSLWTLLFR
jgi:hypothetical protein